MAAVLQVFNIGQFSPGLNHTLVTLFLKKNHVIKEADFISISLGNMIYILISRIIANMLKIIISHIISDSQSTFVPMRQITDNILIDMKFFASQ